MTIITEEMFEEYEAYHEMNHNAMDFMEKKRLYSPSRQHSVRAGSKPPSRKKAFKKGTNE